MNRQHTACSTGVSRRRGFTLIELLVVIAIIGVLVALVSGAVFQMVDAQRQSNTEGTLLKVSQTLKRHWDYVVNEAKKETPPDNVVTMAGGDRERAQVIMIKLRLMEAFPINFMEINSFGPYSSNYIPAGKRRYMATYYKVWEQAGKPSGPRPTESAACLLMALSIDRGGSKLTADQLGTDAIDIDGDGLKEIVDSWGTPVNFFRFPTSSELQADNPNPSAKSFDPLDPLGKLLSPSWSSGKSTFTSMVHPLTSAPGTYIVPVVVSSGRNTRLGLDTRSMAETPPNNNDANDNIYSNRLRQGGKGN